jgi:hypothetical protein
MRHISIYRRADRTFFWSSNRQQIGRLAIGTLMAGYFLAVLCLFFGASFAAFVPASLEQRIGGLIFFGLIPAAGFYACGHILSRLLMLSIELCEKCGTLFFRCSARAVNKFLVWVDRFASDASVGCLEMLAQASLLSTRAYGSIYQSGWRAHAAFVDLLCMAIRSAAVFILRMQASYARLAADTTYHRWGILPLIMAVTVVAAFGLDWYGAGSILPHDVKRDDSTGVMTIDAVVEKIISVESNGDPDAKNKRSSAMGLGQFLDQTWLDLIRTHRPDLASGRNKDKILELRRDADIAREITMRFTEQNAGMLKKRGFPVTPGTLYLAHFAGGAGAVAILSALGDADAASVMASADATGRTKREKIIKANPFLERFTVADLRTWADRKMRVPGS